MMKNEKDEELIKRMYQNFFEKNKPDNAREIKVETAEPLDDCSEIKTVEEGYPCIFNDEIKQCKARKIYEDEKLRGSNSGCFSDKVCRQCVRYKDWKKSFMESKNENKEQNLFCETETLNDSETKNRQNRNDIECKMREAFGPFSVTLDLGNGNDCTTISTFKKEGNDWICSDTTEVNKPTNEKDVESQYALCPMYLSDMEFIFVSTKPHFDVTSWLPNSDEIIYSTYTTMDGSRYLDLIIRPLSSNLYLDTFISDKIYYNAAIGLKWSHDSEREQNFKVLGRGFRVISMDFNDAILSDELSYSKKRRSAENVIKEFKYNIRLEILD